MQTNDAHTTQPPLSLQDIAHFIQIVREFGAGGGITIRKANPAIPFVRDDGGRTQAGIKLGKRAHDCVGRAIAIASQVPYRTVYHDLLSFCKRLGKRSKYAADSHPRSGVYRIVYDRYLRHNG